MSLQSLIKTVAYRLGYSIKRIRPRAPRELTASNRGPVTHGELMQLLHRENPYAGFGYSSYPRDASGWGSDSPAFRELIEKQRPAFIIEVGTWKGGSALQMGRILRELQLPGTILCIDTWLGALEFWMDQADPERYLALQLKHGYPTVYYQFLANVCHEELQECIVPFPQTSQNAALWLRANGLRADLIYIDGSHEEEDVYGDLVDYWEVLRPGGLLFGDDYSWDGVRLAVERFRREQGRAITFCADKWVLTRET